MKKTIIILASLILASCKNGDVKYTYPKSLEDRRADKLGSVVTGEEGSGFSIFNSGKKKGEHSMYANEYLWRGALDVISFMPISSTDSMGGVIVTDWYSDPKTPNEQFKFNISVGNELSATNIKVSAFKQKRINGVWVNHHVSADFVRDLENKILAKAQKLRLTK